MLTAATSPFHKIFGDLDIKRWLKLGLTDLANAPGGTSKGTIMYDSLTNTIIHYNGSSWAELSSASGTPIGEHKFTLTADGSSGFSGGSADVITLNTFTDIVASGNLATFDGTDLLITAGSNDVHLEALIYTSGTGNHSGTLYFRDVADPAGTLLGDGVVTNAVSSKGRYGQASDNFPATAVIRAGTTITLNLINALSGQNQVAQEGSYIWVREIVGQSTVVLPDTLQVNQINKVVGKVFDPDAVGSTGVLTVEGDIISANKTASDVLVVTHPAVALDAITHVSVESRGTIGQDNDLFNPVFRRDSETQLTIFAEETTGSPQNIAYNISVRENVPEYNVINTNDLDLTQDDSLLSSTYDPYKVILGKQQGVWYGDAEAIMAGMNKGEVTNPGEFKCGPEVFCQIFEVSDGDLNGDVLIPSGVSTIVDWGRYCNNFRWRCQGPASRLEW